MPMISTTPPRPLTSLKLPGEYDGLEGLIEIDLQALVHVLASQAHERLRLTPRQRDALETNLWNRLVTAVNETMEPFTIENR
ncbi:hypothetical protein Isop_0470 [Isosphaera pallida ATCC 43644]|uniref:Uncharacterized protein n=1 Tax=Isosphaera pallida (strain ATCC 43644 / DSM 9630 / IS1B) TaxID=575540 RepID=E8QZD8_ISOPI|nr:hypothetical protein [Isosphaera pallida]ADV61065.1 hypothetical protein Isop_0470 [Isosphaera pallida ATCC 43644]